MSHKINDLIVETISNAFTNKINEGKTDEEKRIIKEKLDSIDLEALVDKMISDAAKPVLKEMTKTMYEQVLDFRAEEEEFLAVQKQKWNKAFTTSEALYIMNLEFADSYKDVVNDLTKEEVQQKEWTFLSLQYIHGRALQVYLEIITLMKNGFADGAFARWRTIYELAIVSDFISTYGEETAKEFYESSESDDRYYDWANPNSTSSISAATLSFSA